MTAQRHAAAGVLYAWRSAILLTAHIVLIALANQAAFWLRFDGEIPELQQPLHLSLLPLLIAVRLAVFLPLRLHQGVWRYASLWDLRNIVVAVGVSSALFWIIVHGLLGALAYPRSVFIIDAVLLVLLLSGLRLSRRVWEASGRRHGARRVLIYGAGDAGEMIARDMLTHPGANAVPVGFLDDDPDRQGVRIHGVPVVGGGDAVAEAVSRLRADEILIAMPAAEPKALRRVVDAVSSCHLPIRTLPRLREIPSGEVTLNEVRDLSVADLLTRAPVGLDPSRVRRLIDGQRVLVTGAAGSIGAELCRQILLAEPARIVLLDRHENGLFAIHAELLSRAGGRIVPALGDVTDAERLEQIFERERPSVVFHAAAHKHVPLMEASPCEAVKNNVRGTRLVADAALRWGAAHVVLISTDKAVNPASVMGATKFLAERIFQRYGTAGGTRFCAVRFGNVLGSTGSVVPTFLEQIKAGGPVTVTHQDMRRYFMLIPEAVQLVLHAAAIDEGRGSVYVLDMGEQIRVTDMARDLIRLAGYVPDEDVEIVYTGVRPGEKLSEELVAPDERAEPSPVEKVHQVAAADTGGPGFMAAVEHLERLALQGDEPAVRAALADLVPSLRPAGHRAAPHGPESTAGRLQAAR
jgi:FlaA1/EpsC-like NDP-sugar epimerase